MMKLRDFLAENTLIENTYNLFDYSVFAARFKARFGFRVMRDDYEISELKQIAQNVIDVNLDFLKAFSKRVINPFETWNETDIHNNTAHSTNTTTPDLTDKTTPNLKDKTTPNFTETTTPNLTDTLQKRGDTTNDGTVGNTQEEFVNAYDNVAVANPLSNSKSAGTNHQTNTYNTDDTTTHTGETTVEHTGETTVEHTGETTVTHTGTTQTENDSNGNDEISKNGWNINDYQRTLSIYYDFIDYIIDLMAVDILYITVRG